MEDKQIKKTGRKRLAYGLATLVLLLIEIMIALYVHDKFIRPYVGDVLVVIAIYTFIRIFLPQGDTLLPLYVFIFATGVEFLQLFHIVELLGMGDNRFFRILIGSVFDIKDVFCYAFGCILLEVYEIIKMHPVIHQGKNRCGNVLGNDS